jgi:hypothetical protein
VQLTIDHANPQGISENRLERNGGNCIRELLQR